MKKCSWGQEGEVAKPKVNLITVFSLLTGVSEPTWLHQINAIFQFDWGHICVHVESACG